MTERPIYTYQTRIAVTSEQSVLLDQYAALHGKVQRALFAALGAGRPMNELKVAFCKKYGLLARQFNAVRIELDGKADSIKERRKSLITESAARIKKAEQVVKKLSLRAPHSFKLHHKKRRLAMLKARYDAMEQDHASGAVRLCFGSKKLFRAQFALEANGYADHEAWLADWQRSRSEQFFVVGSGDETAGNGLCQARLTDADSDGKTFALKLRLPDALKGNTDGSTTPTMTLSARFIYGHDDINAALNSSERINAISATGRAVKKLTGTPISYRFLRDEKGWRVFVSVMAAPVAVASSKLLGAIGIDINADHLAVAEADRFGNLARASRINAITYGKSQDQAKAILGDAAKEIAKLALLAGKPVAIERLDFTKKKAELESVKVERSRALSSFAYKGVITAIKSACYRRGVGMIEVNPAYTSTIGAVNHAQRLGLSIHQGAALAIARRSLGLSESATVRLGLVPTRNGGHVTFALPVRNRAKHVWSFWSKTRTSLKAAHVAHHRCGDHQRSPPPLSPAMRASCATWSSPAKSQSANRPPHCSVDVIDEIPE